MFVGILYQYGFAQEGLQISINGQGGFGYIAAQNHYGNDHFRLKYKNKFSYGANFNVGYGFNSQVSLLLTGGYQKFEQGYRGEFDPGLGSGHQSHQKDISLDLLNIGLLTKFVLTMQDAYVYDSKMSFFTTVGFTINKLLKAQLEYQVNNADVAYPAKLPPYTDPNYKYSPVSNAKDLYNNIGLSFVANVGFDFFVSEKLALSPSVQGQISVIDINKKEYRQHEGYRASRVLLAGLNVGLTYYLSR